MNHADHVDLLRQGGIVPGGVWADFGAGSGAFTLAAAELLEGRGTLYAIDRDADVLRQNAAQLAARFPKLSFHTVVADFGRPLQIPSLDGIVMANALHFARDRKAVIRRLKTYLKSAPVSGRLILVEYNTDSGNQWVPYPLSVRTWTQLASDCGFSITRHIGARPSRFLGEIYSCVSY